MPFTDAGKKDVLLEPLDSWGGPPLTCPDCIKIDPRDGPSFRDKGIWKEPEHESDIQARQLRLDSCKPENIRLTRPL